MESRKLSTVLVIVLLLTVFMYCSSPAVAKEEEKSSYKEPKSPRTIYVSDDKESNREQVERFMKHDLGKDTETKEVEPAEHTRGMLVRNAASKNLKNGAERYSGTCQIYVTRCYYLYGVPTSAHYTTTCAYVYPARYYTPCSYGYKLVYPTPCPGVQFCVIP